MYLKKRLSLLCIAAIFNAAIYTNVIAGTIDDAKQAIAKKDYSTAIIHLKNQLKKSPKDAQARFLLGSVYLSTGKMDASLKELGRAHNLAPDNVEILFRYADVLQAAGKQEKILTLLNSILTDPHQESQRLSYRGYAHLTLQQLADAREAFQEASKLEDNSNAYNGLATLAILEKDYDQAEKLISKSLALEKNKSTTLQLKAKLSNLQKNYKQALDIYDALVKKSPTNLSYRLERAATLTILGKNQQAKADLKLILDKIKHHPQANFIKAQILLQEKDFAGAQKAAQDVVNVAPGHMPAAFILGAANFALKQYNQAEEYLTIYLASNPNNLKAQNLLANVYLAQGKNQQSLLILEGIPAKQLNSNPLLLVTLGSTYINMDEAEKGLQYLQQAQALEPENQDIKKRLIAAQFQSGELNNAITELEELAMLQKDSDGSEQQIRSQIQTNYLLIISYIKQKQFSKAEEKINQLLTTTPDDTKLLNLKALTEQLKGNSEQAIAQYQAILKKDKQNIPAYMGLGRIAALQKKWAEAESHFQQVIKINPQALKAYLGLAAIAEKQNMPEAAEQYFMQAIQQSKKNIASQLTIAGLLSQWYQTRQQPEKILKLAEMLDKQHPNDNTIRSFLARAQLINKQPEKAERTLKSIITFDKKDIKHRILLAKLISQDAQRINEAISLLEDAQAIQPDNLTLFSMQASLLIKQEKFNQAVQIARKISDSFPDEPTGRLMEADIYRLQKQPEKALDIYQQVYKENPLDIVFTAIIDMLIQTEQKDKAIELLTKQLKTSPDNIDNLFKLASLHHEKQQLDKASVYYQRILKIEPEQIVTLNNLAWIKADSDLKQAVILSRRAYEQAPDSAAIMDSYGYFLARDKQYKAGLELLQKAAAGLPKDKDIQYHLAYTYEKMGQKDKARVILENIVLSEQPFAEQDKAKKLYQKIN